MIKDVYAAGTEYLYGVPKTETRQSERGVLEVKGVPTTLDLCRFQIGHPDWLVEKANERDVEFSKMKKRLRDLLPMVHNPSKENIIEVFNTAVKLYQNLFTYVFLAQTTSDEVLDIYLDFLKELTGKEYSRDILEMKSDYVERCMNSEVDAGSFQSWSEKTPSPFVWEGMIDYTPFREDKGLISIISAKENSECFLEDYNSFRKIVPLLYQLSEEFFYMSRSINTFLVWGIQHLHELMQNKLGLRVSLDDFNNLSLKQVNDYILMI